MTRMENQNELKLKNKNADYNFKYQITKERIFLQEKMIYKKI